MRKGVTVSVVSHGQSGMVNHLLDDLVRCSAIDCVVITQNTLHDEFVIPSALEARTRVVVNTTQKGFGENHNAAFGHCSSAYFCVINPDIRLPDDPFPVLLEALSNHKVGLTAPLIVNPAGSREDSARRFPSPFGLFKRILRLESGTYACTSEQIEPEWVAGMFMLFRRDAFHGIGGFDEGFFLYCEDTDICLRLHAAGSSLVVTSRARAIHDAQRSSHRNFRYLYWHVGSMLRLWRKHPDKLFAG